MAAIKTMTNKSIKKSVRLAQDTVKTLSVISDHGGLNWSGSLNKLASNYRLFVDSCLPELSKNELLAFQIAYNGYIPHQNIQEEMNILPWNISESYKYDEQVRDLFNDDEIAAFLEKINNWADHQKMAVIYKAREFWAGGPVAE
jgi:hypothetical protein